MGSDVHLQDQMDEFEEQQRQRMALEAAVLVLGGQSRDSAVHAIKNAYMAQADATENEIVRDEHGFPEYLLEEAQTPELPRDPKTLRQAQAIANTLVDKFE